MYGAINIHYPKAWDLYVMQFTSMQNTLHNSIELNSDTITERNLVCDEIYMSPAQENPCWYLELEDGSINTTVSFKKIFLSQFSFKLLQML